MKRLKTVRFLSRVVGALVAVGLPSFIAMVWLTSYLGPFRTGRTVLAYHYVWLTKGYEVACAHGEIQISVAIQQYFDGDSEATLKEFLETDSGAAAITGWYCERVLPDAVSGSLPTGSIREHLGIHLISEKLLADDGAPTGIILPCWLLMALSVGIGSPFYISFFRRRRACRRLLHSRCATCGYDLCFSGRVCPECGTEVAVATGAEVKAPI